MFRSAIFLEFFPALSFSFSNCLLASEAAFLESSSLDFADSTCLSRFSSFLTSPLPDFFVLARSDSAFFLADSWTLRSLSALAFSFFRSLIFFVASLAEVLAFWRSSSAFFLAFLAASRLFSAAALSFEAASAAFFWSAAAFFSASAFFLAASVAFFSASAFFLAASAACLSLAALPPLASAMRGLVSPDIFRMRKPPPFGRGRCHPLG